MAIAASVDELVLGRLTYRKSAKNEGPGVVGDLLIAAVPLLTDKLDCLQPLQSASGDADTTEDRLYDFGAAVWGRRERKIGLREPEESLSGVIASCQLRREW